MYDFTRRYSFGKWVKYRVLLQQLAEHKERSRLFLTWMNLVQNGLKQRRFYGVHPSGPFKNVLKSSVGRVIVSILLGRKIIKI